jgi:hypothetical protein
MKLEGIYWDKSNNKVYYINSVKDGVADLSTVKCRHLWQDNMAMLKVLDDHIKRDSKIVENFYHCGRYTRQEINN